VSLYESILEFLQLGWARNIIKPLLAVTLVVYFHVKTIQSDSQFKQLLFFGLIASFLSEVLSVFSQTNTEVQTFCLLISAASYFLFMGAFTLNIYEGKISTGIAFVAAFAVPYILIGALVFLSIKNNIEHFKVTVFLYLIALYGMGIQSAVRNFNTNSKSFTRTAVGVALIVLSESALLIIHFKNWKLWAIQGLAVFLKNLGRYGLVIGCLEHIQYFFIEKKELLGQSLFGPARKENPRAKTM